MTTPSPSPVAVLENPITIEVTGAGRHKDCQLVDWPTRADCLAARGTVTPVTYKVRFPGDERVTEILLYVTMCPGDLGLHSFMVKGMTGQGQHSLSVTVLYDYPGLYWGSRINPDAPRIILYADPK